MVVLHSKRWNDTICEIADEINEPYGVAERLMEVAIEGAAAQINVTGQRLANHLQDLACDRFFEFTEKLIEAAKKNWYEMPERVKNHLRG